jgi:hypothetical protein
MKGMTLNVIHDDLVRTLRKEAVVYSTVTKSVRSAQFSGRKEASPAEAPDVECSPVDEECSWLLPNFHFCFSFSFSFRLCASFRGGSVLRDPPCTSTSCNHFASRCDIFDGSPTFRRGTEADSGPIDNQTIAGPLGAKQAPVTRHCHLRRIVYLFVQ